MINLQITSHFIFIKISNNTNDKAATRETKEEGGIDINIKGILRFEYTPRKSYVRFRVIFYAEPVNDEDLPKSIPDYESAGACWLSVDELVSDEVSLRGREPMDWIPYHNKGGPVYPIDLLTLEGFPPPDIFL
eukprot:TRINITY_DN1301_c0_g2_i1.p1 TRINITY_DN1301_c0_g2~~TRINITY_DN1301_c0_g2_i1.p1  ORF type:complete len:133 (+),score=29.39 TRINITY_DN1301_c0_g2_i1:116-514(+)